MEGSWNHAEVGSMRPISERYWCDNGSEVSTHEEGVRARCLQRLCVCTYARAQFHEVCTHTRVQTHAHTVCRYTRPAKHARDGRQVLCAPLATSPTWPYPFSSPTQPRNTALTQPTEMSARLDPRCTAVIARHACFCPSTRSLPRLSLLFHQNFKLSLLFILPRIFLLDCTITP